MVTRSGVSRQIRTARSLAVTHPRERGITTARSRARTGRLCTVPDFRPGGLGAISSSRCQTTRTRWDEPHAGANRCTSGRAAAGCRVAAGCSTHTRRCASNCKSGASWAGIMGGHHGRASWAGITSGPIRSNGCRLVEPDGIEPTTSCLQSRRSPN
jgi:hypothetical protein